MYHSKQRKMNGLQDMSQPVPASDEPPQAKCRHMHDVGNLPIPGLCHQK